MHKIDAPGATAGNEFTDGDIGSGIPPTQMWSKWANTIQRELVAVVQAAGLTLSDVDDTQLLQAINLIRPGLGLRNRIQNGDFRFWQRTGAEGGDLPASVTTTDALLPDRWYCRAGSTGGSATVNRQAFTLGQTDVPGEPTYYLEWIQSVASSGLFPRLITPIENVRTMAGQTVTLSWWARVTSGTLPIQPKIVQDFGAGGSADVIQTETSQVATTTWQRFYFDVTLPSITGKTIGTDHYLGAALELVGVSWTGTLQLADIQLEPGSTPTVFERIPDFLMLEMLERFYEKTYEPDEKPGKSGAGLGPIVYWDPTWPSWPALQGIFRVRKYMPAAAVAAVPYDFTGGAAGTILFGGTQYPSTMGNSTSTMTGQPTVGGSPPNGRNLASCHYTADHEIPL